MVPARDRINPRLAYVVSRFPSPSETFVVRELNAVSESWPGRIELFALFPPLERFAHPAARGWVARLRRPSPIAAVRGFLYWAVRRPVRLAGAVGTTVRCCAARPPVLGRSLVTLALGAALAREARALGIAHVHAHFATYPALAAWLCRRLTGTPYSFTAHAHDLYVDQSMLEVKLSEAEFAVTVSEYNRRFLEPYGGGRATPVQVVHCGIEPERYGFRPRSPAGRGVVRALCVASLQEYKGHAVLLEALAAGGDALSRLELDLVGSGELRPVLERRCAELGLTERVRFHGAMAEPQVRDMLERADLFVLPSRVASNGKMEGLPVALMEAAASGLVTVATRLSGIPELIRDRETGLLAEPGDAESLGNALAAALSGSPSIRLEDARRLVEREFDVRRSAARLVELFADQARAPRSVNSST